MSYDVFISHRHSRREEVLALCELLQRAGLAYYRDEERRDDDVSIQRGIARGCHLDDDRLFGVQPFRGRAQAVVLLK